MEQASRCCSAVLSQIAYACSFDEGNFSVLGYVTEGLELLQQIQPGDTIKSARLVDGLDKLIIPATARTT